MDKTWTDEFYREMDADKRLVLLKENIESNPTEEDAFRKKLWIARYGRKKPKTSRRNVGSHAIPSAF